MFITPSRLKSFTDVSGDEQEVQRLNEDSDDLIRWPNTIGYVYTSRGVPLSEESTRRAYDLFNMIREEARTYYTKEFKMNSGGAKVTARAKTRLLTFYNSRMRKAMELVRKEESPGRQQQQQQQADEIETILSGTYVCTQHINEMKKISFTVR